MEFYNCSMYWNAIPPGSYHQMKALGTFGVAFTTVGSVCTFIVTVLFVAGLFLVVKRSPSQWRRLLTWITSMPMIVSILSLVTFIVPGAAILCDTVKQSYLPFLLVHFVDLTFVMEGGHTGMLTDLSSTTINLCVPPWCCAGLCIKDKKYDKKKLRIIKSLVYQMPLIQLIVNLLVTILETAGALERILADGAFLFLGLFNILFFMTGMWGFNILTGAFAEFTTWSFYRMKAKVLFVCILIFKVQSFVLLIVALCNGIPCIPAYEISVTVVRKTLDAALCIGESFLFGLIFFPLYRANNHGCRRLDSPISTTSLSTLAVSPSTTTLSTVIPAQMEDNPKGVDYAHN